MKKILVVDDNIDIWEKLFTKLFSDVNKEGKKKYDFGFSKNGKKLIKDNKSINFSEYDVLIVDYFLKNNKNGVDWVKENVKSRDPYLPVIFWTSSMDAKIIQKTLIGEHVFFKKQLNLEYFKKVIDDSINKRQQYKKYPLYNDFFNTKIIDTPNRKLAHNVYINTSKYLESFFAHSKYHSVFNSHGLIHTQNVLNNLSKLMYPIADEFSQEEFLVAYISTILHDFGMMPVHYNDDMEYKDFKTLRDNHAKTIFWWIATGQIEKHLGFKFTDEIRIYIAMITLYHDAHYDFSEFFSTDLEAFKDIENSIKKNGIHNLENHKVKFEDIKDEMIETFNKDNKKENYEIIAGLVALADKLDYGSSRVPISVIRKSPYRGLKDEFEYLINECFLSYDFKQKNNKTIIEIETIDFKPKPKLYEICFKAFQHEIKNGKVTSESYRIAAYMLEHIIKEKWENIHKGLKNCNIDFLKNLEIKFSVSSDNKEMKDYNLFSGKNNFIFKNIDREKLEGLDIFEKELIKYVFNEGYGKTLKYQLLSTGFSSEKVLLFPNLKKQVCLDKERSYELKLNNVLLKIGDYKKIHQEVQNYRKYAVPYINPRSLIGYIEEFKYLDKAAFKSLITPKEAKTLDEFINNYDKIKKILDAIKKSLNIFYDKIKPFKNKKLNKKIIDKFERENKKINASVKDKEVEKQTNKITAYIRSIFENGYDTTFSISHGDFTFRNILKIDDNYIFIDFAHTGLNHFFLDFAKLEHFIIVERFITKETDKESKNEILNSYLKEEITDISNLSAMQKKVSDIKFTINKFLYKEIDKAKIDKDITFEMNLARLFVNLHSLRFEGDFPLKLPERLELVVHFYDKVKEQKNGI